MKKTLLFSNVVGDVTEKEISNIKLELSKESTDYHKILELQAKIDAKENCGI